MANTTLARRVVLASCFVVALHGGAWAGPAVGGDTSIAADAGVVEAADVVTVGVSWFYLEATKWYVAGSPDKPPEIELELIVREVPNPPPALMIAVACCVIGFAWSRRGRGRLALRLRSIATA